MQNKGWHSRGYLPHFDSQDVMQFVTCRLAEPSSANVIFHATGKRVRDFPITLDKLL